MNSIPTCVKCGKPMMQSVYSFGWYCICDVDNSDKTKEERDNE